VPLRVGGGSLPPPLHAPLSTLPIYLQHLELKGTRGQDDVRVALLGDGVDDQLCAIVCGYNTVHHLQDPPEKNQSHFHGRPGG
jgi:hypothetical protein